jgi:hypothetical protein
MIALSSPVVLLITTALKPPADIPFLGMTGVAERTISAKAALFFWAGLGVKKIVLADATNTLLLNDADLDLLGRMEVQIEQLAYQQDDALVVSRGKGYGEGMLISYALQNSKVLLQANSFFKSTSKTYCRNLGPILDVLVQNDIKKIFWQYLGDGDFNRRWVDLRFFYTSRRFCEDCLIEAFLQSDDKIAAAEHYVFNLLNSKLQSAKTIRPLISGFSGGLNQAYFDDTLGHLDRYFPCWIDRGGV